MIQDTLRPCVDYQWLICDRLERVDVPEYLGQVGSSTSTEESSLSLDGLLKIPPVCLPCFVGGTLLFVVTPR